MGCSELAGVGVADTVGDCEAMGVGELAVELSIGEV